MVCNECGKINLFIDMQSEKAWADISWIPQLNSIDFKLEHSLNAWDPILIKEEGHEVLKLEDNGDGTFELYIKKVGD